MNDITLPEIAADLAREGLAGGTFGKETAELPTFPLQGMLWWSRQRPFFEMIGVRDSKHQPSSNWLRAEMCLCPWQSSAGADASSCPSLWTLAAKVHASIGYPGRHWRLA